MKPRLQTLDDIRIQRALLRRKIRETEALIAGQVRLDAIKRMPNLDAELQKFSRLARIFSFLARAERRVRQLKKCLKSWQAEWGAQDGAWAELAKVALPLLIGLLTKRSGK